MKLQELLPFLAENQNEFKVHCATPNGENNPLSIWLSGQDNFTKDQNIQTKKNFERKYILSFCEINKNGEWLFVGIYESFGVKEIIKDKNTGKELNIYDTELIEEGKEFIGKLVVGFDLKEESPSAARQRYRYLESLLDKMEVLELKREVLKVEFPGYDKVNISWKDLENVIEDEGFMAVMRRIDEEAEQVDILAQTIMYDSNESNVRSALTQFVTLINDKTTLTPEEAQTLNDIIESEFEDWGDID